MEKNTATRKYGGRKNYTPSRFQPNSDAALNSSTSGKAKAFISVELSGTATLQRTPKGNELSSMGAQATKMRDRDLPEKFQFQLRVLTSDEGSPDVKLTLTEYSDQVPQIIGNAKLAIEVFEGATTNADESGDHRALHDAQKEKKAEAAKGAITAGHRMSLDGNVTALTPVLRRACASPAVDSGKKRQVSEKNSEMADDDIPASRNVKRLSKRRDAESSERGKCVAADSQRNTRSTKPSSKIAARSVPKVANKDDKDRPSETPPGNYNPSKSSSSCRRIPARRSRRASDLLDDNSHPKIGSIRKQDAPRDANKNASAKSAHPVPPSDAENEGTPRMDRQNRKRKIQAEVVQKDSDKEVRRKLAENLQAIRSITPKDYSTGRLPQNRANRTWSCSRPRMPRRRNTSIRFSLDPIEEDDRENEDSSDDNATQVSLPDDSVVKSADHPPPSGASHFPLNSNGQSRDIIPFEKAKAPSDIRPSLRGSSTGLDDGGNFGNGSSQARLQESRGYDEHKRILDPKNGDRRIRTSTTAKQSTKEYAVPPKVQASQSMNMDLIAHGSPLQHTKTMMEDKRPDFDFNVTGTDKLDADYAKEASIRNRAELPLLLNHSGTDLQQILKHSDDTTPAMNFLRLVMEASKLLGAARNVNSGGQSSNGSSYPHDYNANFDICSSSNSHNMTPKLNCSGKNNPDTDTIGETRENSLKREKMKSPISSSGEMATKPKGSTSKVVGSPQDCSNVRSQNKTPGKLNPQSADADASGSSLVIAEIPKPVTCVLNKNPADFSAPGPKNPYMIHGEDLKFDRAAKSNYRGYRNQRNLKHTAGNKYRSGK